MGALPGLLLFVASAQALQLRGSSSHIALRCVGRAAIPTLQAPEPPPPSDDDDVPDPDGAALAAAFKQRLDAEGGEKMFKLKSDAGRVGESLQDGATNIFSGVKDAGNKILDVGTSRGSNSGLLCDSGTDHRPSHPSNSAPFHQSEPPIMPAAAAGTTTHGD
jgi:hypothetical protein